jgi:hypothetical protein
MQVRELFSKFGVAGTLLDNVVKSVSSSDETLLKFMRKVRHYNGSILLAKALACSHCSG